MTDSSSDILISLKKEELNSIEIVEEQISYEGLDARLLGLDDKPNIHEINETDAEKNSDTYHNFKRHKKRGRSKSSGKDVKRAFSLKWLTRPGIKEWVAPVSDKPYVCCKWCKIFIRAHASDLVKHSRSMKHKKNSSKYKAVSLCNLTDSANILNYEEFFQPSAPKRASSTCFLSHQANSKHDKDNAFHPASIGFIGCGNMAQALISGFLSNELIDPGNIIVSAPSAKNLVKLNPLGVKTTHDNKLVVEQSDMIFLAVKPHIIPEVFANLETLEESTRNPLFVSMATGLNLNRLEAMLSHIVRTPRVIRIMPNTPCMVLQGCCVYSLGTNVVATEGKAIKCFLGAVGVCEEVPEYQIDAVCGVAGSGPAYIYAAIEAMADGAVKMGLPRTLATALAAQTVKGAATMVLETGKHPGQLKDEVCSPGGTTITAMHSLEKNGFRGTLMSAVEASANRSKELG